MISCTSEVQWCAPSNHDSFYWFLTVFFFDKLLLVKIEYFLYHGSHRPGKVMEFNPWLEKSLNFMFTWKNGILPGKVIENQWKSLKNFMCHVKLNLNMKTLMIIWLKVSLCHYIWDQIGETRLADLHSRASCYIVADSWTTCYIVAVKPSQAAYAGKASMIKAPCLWLFLMRSLWCRKLHLTGKKIKWISGKSFFNQQCKCVCLIMMLSMDKANS